MRLQPSLGRGREPSWVGITEWTGDTLFNTTRSIFVAMMVAGNTQPGYVGRNSGGPTSRFGGLFSCLNPPS